MRLRRKNSKTNSVTEKSKNKRDILVLLTGIIALIVFYGCLNPVTVTCSNIEQVKIAYIPRDVLTYSPVSNPEDIVMYDQTKYATFKDTVFMCDLLNSIKKLQKTTNEGIADYRIICYIYLHNKKEAPIKLYIGNDSIIVLNNKQMSYNQDLINLIELKLNLQHTDDN